jgi:hypothetical protein
MDSVAKDIMPDLKKTQSEAIEQARDFLQKISILSAVIYQAKEKQE